MTTLTPWCCNFTMLCCVPLWPLYSLMRGYSKGVCPYRIQIRPGYSWIHIQAVLMILDTCLRVPDTYKPNWIQPKKNGLRPNRGHTHTPAEYVMTHDLTAQQPALPHSLPLTPDFRLLGQPVACSGAASCRPREDPPATQNGSLVSGATSWLCTPALRIPQHRISRRLHP
jgi:hypothetical protein